MRRNVIYWTERNIHGAWVVWGEIGIRQFYYYTENQAIDLYIAECKEKGIIVEEK